MSGHVTNPSYFISFVKPAPAKVACGLAPVDPAIFLRFRRWQHHSGSMENSRVVADSRRNTVATPNASTTLTTSGNQPVDASLPAAVYSPVSERDFPPRAERLAAPGGTGIERPGIPKIVTVLSGSSSALSALAIPAGSHGTERRDAVVSKRETVGQCRVSEVVGTVGQSQNLGRKTVGQFYGISLPLRLLDNISKRETVGQFRAPEVLETVGQSQNVVRKTVRWFYGISLCWCIEVVGQSRSEKLKVSDNLKGGWRWRADFGSLLIVFGHLATTDSRRRDSRAAFGRLS
ncbi:hypothetical protein Bbelb_126970 [Branchiostoma belcheri]|nr:hypothetical protein Bbelb_126970 [Branchiostoma belcheri]